MSTDGGAGAQQLVERLGLSKHPEGGWYREVHRAPGAGRSPLTVIYFLLAREDVSRWHRVRTADEAWSLLEGELELFTLDAEMDGLAVHRLGPAPGAEPLAVVAAGRWQAARPSGAYALVTCAVGPGFEFSDFDLLRDLPEQASRLRRTHPRLEELL